MPSFGLNSWKKHVSHTSSLQWQMYFSKVKLTMDISYNELEVRDCGTTTLECLNFKVQKLKLVGWDWMGTKMENHTKRFIILPSGAKILPCATFVGLNIWKTFLWEFFGSPWHSKFIPLSQLNNFLFFVHERVHKHLNFFSEHLRL